MSKKVLMVLMGLEIGGAETHVVELSKELRRQGWEVSVVSNGGVYEKELLDAGISCHHAPLHKRNVFLMLRSYGILRRCIREEKPDVVHAHARIPAFLCGLLQKRMGFPFVTSAHWVFYVNPILKRIANWGERTVAVSDDIKAYVIENYGVPAEHISVTINGIDTEKFSPAVSGARVMKEFGLDPSRPVISYVSRMDESRALAARQLVAIAPRLREAIPGVQLLIAGGGDVFDEIKARADTVNAAAGETFVVFGAIGFWMPLCRAKIPRATFLEQGTLDATRRIVANSDLPAFHTAVAASRAPAPEGRVVIPLRDPEATATYHFVCRADHADALAPVFDALPAP